MEKTQENVLNEKNIKLDERNTKLINNVVEALKNSVHLKEDDLNVEKFMVTLINEKSAMTIQPGLNHLEYQGILRTLTVRPQS